MDPVWKKHVEEVQYKRRRAFESAVKVKVPIVHLETSRRKFPYRPFLTKGGRVLAESMFGGTFIDGKFKCDLALLAEDLGARCKMCHAITEIPYLDEEKKTCPDCDGRSEANRYCLHGKPEEPKGSTALGIAS